MPVFPADITAVILAGGLGTRLRPVVSDLPKAMAPVNGSPFIFRLLDRLALEGVRHAVICTGYLADMLEKSVGGARGNLHISYSREDAPLGTGGAVRKALDYVSTETVLVMNGDSWCDFSLRDFLTFQRRNPDAGAMALAQVPDISRYGSVIRDANGAVVSFAEKGEARGAGLINAGIYLFPRTIIETLPQGENSSLERELFPLLVPDALYGFSDTGRFIDIGIPEDYRAAQVFFQEGTSPLHHVEAAS